MATATTAQPTRTSTLRTQAASQTAPAVRRPTAARGHFRQHATAPALASPLLRQLCREWVDLQATPAAAAAVATWGRTDPALQGCHSPGDVVDLLDRAPRDLVDQVLRCLLQQLHQGDQVAGRVLLQAMLGCLTNLARRCGRPREVVDADEQLQRTITEFWSVIAQPRPLPNTGLAGRLQLDTLKRLTAHRRSPDAWEEHTTYAKEDDWLDNAASWAGAGAGAGAIGSLGLVEPNASSRQGHPSGASPTAGTSPDLGASYDPDAGLYELVIHARANGVLTAEEAQFLADVYLVPEAGDNLADAARRLGLSPAAVRQRCCRIRARLIAAVLEENAGTFAQAS